MNLTQPPFLQIALDLVVKQDVYNVVPQIPKSDKILIEAGTPLIKKFGSSMIEYIRSTHPNAYIIADMKTLDVGSLEVEIAADASANAIAISGLAPIETIESALETGMARNCDIIFDCMNIVDPIALISQFSKMPKIILFHRGIDQEKGVEKHPWQTIREIKEKHKDSLIAVAGGLDIETSAKALNNGADIIVIGRAITQARSVGESINKFLNLLN